MKSMSLRSSWNKNAVKQTQSGFKKKTAAKKKKPKPRYDQRPKQASLFVSCESELSGRIWAVMEETYCSTCSRQIEDDGGVKTKPKYLSYILTFSGLWDKDAFSGCWMEEKCNK